MNKNEGVNLLQVFGGVLVVTSFLIFGVHYFFGFEVSVLFAFCWLAGTISTVAVGIENTINQKN